MDKIVDYLKQLDLSDVEARLYLTLLQTGPTSVRDLAATIDIKRTTTYFYIDQLVEKSLLMKLVKGSKKLVAANEPENLKPLVDAKLASAKAVQQGFPTILKILTTTLPKGNNSTDAEIKYYKGKAGVKKIYEDALLSNEVRSYVNVTEIDEVFPENFKLFENAFKRNPHIKMYEIAEDSPQSKKLTAIADKWSTYQYKILPKNMRITAQDILIYDGKISIINLKDNVHGVILRNNDLSNNLKMLFDFIWKTLL
ncbi:MAG TPA: helix-turn-helix domain-containing protein [Candidatus Sulfotelmatobacter sp.]|jgi:sugar-specific transcriptional regulator TrmB|nr:helix-turn-helix domain-containing protein [Candidatus Sulfotelmatobacter sp.]